MIRLATQSSRPVWKSALLCAALVLLAGAIYWPVHQFGFLSYDDQTYVWQNRHVHTGFTSESLHYAFTTGVVGGWMPLLWISFIADQQLFAGAAGIMHLENVFWHAVGGLMLWWALTKLTAASLRSWIVAAIFICHPMHVESVAWISERKDVLSTPLLLAAILAYSFYCTSKIISVKWTAYGFAMVFFILSLMTKAMGVTLPILLLLLDFWPLRRTPYSRRRLIEKLPFAAITLGFAWIALRSEQSNGAADAGSVLSLFDRIGNGIVCYVIYIVKLLVPKDLAAFYPHPGSRPIPIVIAAAGLLFIVTAIAVRLRAKGPYFLFGWLWFIIALLPVIGIKQVGGQAMADRFSYLPSIGFFVAIVWGVGDLFAKFLRSPDSRPGRAIATILVVAVIAVFSGLARRQVWYWNDTETLFTHSYQVTGPNPVACFAIGTAAYARGELRTAVDQLTEVIDEDPGNDKAFKLLGDLWLSADQSKSIDYYQQAVSLKPAKTDYLIALAAALTRRGDMPSLHAAEDQLGEVLRTDPTNPQARAGLSDVRGREKLK